jgi:hypothetical protein
MLPAPRAEVVCLCAVCCACCVLALGASQLAELRSSGVSAGSVGPDSSTRLL